MAKVVRVELRICPKCGWRYQRNVYDKNSVDSICPKCRRRSDHNFMSPTRYVSPAEPVLCKNPDCDNLFYKQARQEYCPDCYKIIRREKNRLYIRAYRKRKKQEKNKGD